MYPEVLSVVIFRHSVALNGVAVRREVN